MRKVVAGLACGSIDQAQQTPARLCALLSDYLAGRHYRDTARVFLATNDQLSRQSLQSPSKCDVAGGRMVDGTA